MNELIPFHFETHDIRVVTDDSGEPWFNANDVCAALELANPRDAIAKHIDSDDVAKRDIIDSLGRVQLASFVNESGLYALIFGSTKEEAKRFKRWITSEVLPALRKTGHYAAPGAKEPAPSAIQPTKEFKALFSVARLIGLDKNAAAISANQATAKLTGTNVMQLLGSTHLEAEQQSIYFTPTELGARSGISARGFNRQLAAAGFQVKRGDHWVPLTKAEGFCRVLDTGKRHTDGTMVQQVKWAESVLSLIERAAA